MHPMMNIASFGARKAGNLIVKNYYKTPYSLELNQTSNNIAINVDKAAREVIIKTIRKFYPQHTIISNDTTSIHEGIDKDIQWIIDSLGDITNFVKNFPHFATSIAIRIKNRTEISVIYDPIRNELFTAIRGQGAKLNSYRLRGSSARSLDETVLAIGFSLKEKKQYVSLYINILKKFLSKCSGIRCTGSSTLDLAYVAAGRVDGYFDVDLHLCHFAAGELIAREAGALVCDFTGSHNYITNGNIIAGNPRIIKAMLMTIRNKLNIV